MHAKQSKESTLAAARRPSTLYVCAPEDDFPVKIGITNDLGSRLCSLQSGCWHALKMRAAFFALKPRRAEGEWLSASECKANCADTNATVSGARAFEAACHRTLKSLDVHMRGEWFAITVTEAIEVIAKVAKNESMVAVPVHEVIKWDNASISRPDDRKAYQRLMASAIEAAECLGKSADELTERESGVYG